MSNLAPRNATEAYFGTALLRSEGQFLLTLCTQILLLRTLTQKSCVYRSLTVCFPKNPFQEKDKLSIYNLKGKAMENLHERYPMLAL